MKQPWIAEMIFGDQPFDPHGMSCYLRDGDRVFHPYPSYGRGAKGVGGRKLLFRFHGMRPAETTGKDKERIIKRDSKRVPIAGVMRGNLKRETLTGVPVAPTSAGRNVAQ